MRVGPASLYVPVKIEDLQLDALARITFRPLVDKLPCIGAVSVALMDTPFVDLTLKLINDWDIMSLPFIHDAVLMGAKIGAEPVCRSPRSPRSPPSTCCTLGVYRSTLLDPLVTGLPRGASHPDKHPP